MVAQFASGVNTFVLDHEASHKLRIDFSRDPKKFGLNRYAQIVPVTKMAGYYLKMTIEEAARVSADGAEYAWPDGAEAPNGADGLESFEYLGFLTKRFAYPFRLGEHAVDQASWDIIGNHTQIHRQKAMTKRTTDTVTAMTTSGNYDSSHVSAVASISGNTGTWAASTTARSDIKRSLNFAANKILLDTNGAVSPEDLKLVINPNLAAAMAQSQEVVDYIKGSPDAKAALRGEMASRNRYFGLPDQMYGFDIEVEYTVRVTTPKGATTSRSLVMDNAKAAMVSRPGGLVGEYGSPSFSTVTVFVYTPEDMAVYTKHDVDNKRHIGRIEDNFGVVVTAPVSGFLFTDCQ